MENTCAHWYDSQQKSNEIISGIMNQLWSFGKSSCPERFWCGQGLHAWRLQGSLWHDRNRLVHKQAFFSCFYCTPTIGIGIRNATCGGGLAYNSRCVKLIKLQDLSWLLLFYLSTFISLNLQCNIWNFIYLFRYIKILWF